MLACSVLDCFLTSGLELAMLIESLCRAEEPVRTSIYSCKEVGRNLEELH